MAKESLTPSNAARFRGLPPLVRALRPRQWTKNGLLFVPLAFTLNIQQPILLGRAVTAFVLFCAISSAGYLLNDLVDLDSDRKHPRKRYRPIAAGLVSARLAAGLAVLLAVAGVLGALAMSPVLGLLALGYLLLTAAYTLCLKHLVLLDVFSIAAGFVLRSAAGAATIAVPISPWFYLATLLGALLLGLGKRRSELRLLGDAAPSHRGNLQAYSVKLLDTLVAVTAGALAMTYALYTFSATNLPSSHSMMLTIPFAFYGIFRYLLLLHRGVEAEAPEELFLRDRPLAATVVGWALLAVLVNYLDR